jgi:zinc finger protein
VAAPCPVCAEPRATLRTIQLDLPYFGEVFETVFMCPACGFRHADTLIPRVGEPTEFTLRVEGERDLFIRVVKSSSATVEVPELGLLWEPGPASEAEVTNVEGLIVHFEDAVGRARVLFPGRDAQERADELSDKLQALRDARGQATLVLKDPYGNSALVGGEGRVRRRVMGAEEASALATGEYILEASSAGRPEQLRRATDHGAR